MLWKFLFTTLGLPTADDNLDGYRISDVTSQGKINNNSKSDVIIFMGF